MTKARVLVALLALVGGLVLATWFQAVRAPRLFAEPRIVSIRRGESFATVANRMAEAGVVRSAWAFIIYGKGLGHAARVMPGDYAFPGGQSFALLMERLVKGDSMIVVIPIQEGLTAHQIGEKLAQAGLGCQSAFSTAVLDGRLVESLGFGGLGVEGFLFQRPTVFRRSSRTTRSLQQCSRAFTT